MDRHPAEAEIDFNTAEAQINFNIMAAIQLCHTQPGEKVWLGSRRKKVAALINKCEEVMQGLHRDGQLEQEPIFALARGFCVDVPLRIAKCPMHKLIQTLGTEKAVAYLVELLDALIKEIKLLPGIIGTVHVASEEHRGWLRNACNWVMERAFAPEANWTWQPNIPKEHHSRVLAWVNETVLLEADMNAHCLCVICDFQGDMKQYIVLQTSIVDDAEEVLPADGTTHSFNEEGKERVYHVLMHEIAHLLHHIVEHRLQGQLVGEHTVFSPDRSDAKTTLTELTNDSGYLLEEQLLNSDRMPFDPLGLRRSRLHLR